MERRPTIVPDMFLPFHSLCVFLSFLLYFSFCRTLTLSVSLVLSLFPSLFLFFFSHSVSIYFVFRSLSLSPLLSLRLSVSLMFSLSFILSLSSTKLYLFGGDRLRKEFKIRSYDKPPMPNKSWLKNYFFHLNFFKQGEKNLVPPTLSYP